ncbi:MAG: hypothetical protein ABIB43_02050 [archaeon]
MTDTRSNKYLTQWIIKDKGFDLEDRKSRISKKDQTLLLKELLEGSGEGMAFHNATVIHRHSQPDLLGRGIQYQMIRAKELFLTTKKVEDWYKTDFPRQRNEMKHNIVLDNICSGEEFTHTIYDSSIINVSYGYGLSKDRLNIQNGGGIEFSIQDFIKYDFEIASKTADYYPVPDRTIDRTNDLLYKDFNLKRKAANHEDYKKMKLGNSDTKSYKWNDFNIYISIADEFDPLKSHRIIAQNTKHDFSNDDSNYILQSLDKELSEALLGKPANITNHLDKDFESNIGEINPSSFVGKECSTRIEIVQFLNRFMDLYGDKPKDKTL